MPSITGVYVGSAGEPPAPDVRICQVNFQFLPSDYSNPANGPNGKDCAATEQRVDPVPFDHHFTCNCSKTHYRASDGGNCDAASTSSHTTEIVAVCAAVAVIIVCLAVFITKRIARKRLERNRPETFDAIHSALFLNSHNELLRDIDAGDFGMIVTVHYVDHHGSSSTDSGSERRPHAETLENFTAYLRTGIRKICGSRSVPEHCMEVRGGSPLDIGLRKRSIFG